jgi:hypothetical protein
MSLPNMTTQQFLAAAQEVAERMPGAELAKNPVGNLTILDSDGDYVGWIDLRYGEVMIFEDDRVAD